MSPSDTPQSRFGSMPPSVPIIGAILAALAFMAGFTSLGIMTSTVMIGAMELGAAAMIVLAGGGLAWPLVSRLAPSSMPRSFVAVTAAATGLWILSVLMLVFGSLGLMSAWLWWGVIIVGLLAAGFASRGHLSRTPDSPSRVDGRALIWVVCGAAIGMWLAGAMRPPGFTSMGGDVYDVLVYHLQVPREFYNAGRIHQLTHNVYSHYPLGTEMLSLMAMCLRGGAYDGMYLGQMMHGVFGALAVVGLILGLRDDEDTRGRFGGAMLATYAPLLYLSWLAFSELAMVCYLTLALIWLRSWLRESRWQTAAGIGVLLGAACGAKYLAVGFVAGPVLAVMLVTSLRNAQRLSQLLLAATIALLIFSPWMIRNTVLTGNPVFPLATDVFGQGYWTDMQAHRWNAGHAPGQHPPVPNVPGWQAGPPTSRGWLLWETFASSGIFNPMATVIAIISLCAMAAFRDALRKYAWEFALLGVLIVQLAVWITATHSMQWRFIVPSAVPLVLLASWGLARVSEIMYNPFTRNAAEKGVPPGWGRVASVSLLLAVMIVGVVATVGMFNQSTLRYGPAVPMPGEEVRNATQFTSQLPPEAKLAFIGETRVFYARPGTLYATTFDPHPLDRPALSADELRAYARELGLTHLFVNWAEVWRLGGTYGITPTFTEGLYERWKNGLPPTLPLLENLDARTIPILLETEEGTEPMPGTVFRPDVPAPDVTRWKSIPPPAAWPVVSLYALPPADAPEDWTPEPIVVPLPQQQAEQEKQAPAPDAPQDAPATAPDAATPPVSEPEAAPPETAPASP